MRRRWLPFAYLFLLLLVGAAFIDLPYYVMKPGDAHPLKPMIEVEGGDKDDGTLMMTTIRMGEANYISYLIASIRDEEEIRPVEEVRRPHESNEEYNVRQEYLMDNSQQDAITVAFDAADKPYTFHYQGIYVLNVFPNMPADGKLVAGDRITAIDGKRFESSKQFIDYVQSRKAGEKITVSFVREGKEREKAIQLKSFANNAGKPGLGISLADHKELVSRPEVKLKADAIGGPSAGLMFSLEIYNQLVEEDIAKGRKVAGTGTIDAEGNVGRIGGIAQKVVAAHKAGAEVFLAPADEISPEMRKKLPGIQSNYEEAVEAAKALRTEMKVVPVHTFKEALDYLLSE
ncbi:SepM family pheromone-processing serine protease [Bacillus thermotolerans]|uniref:SepM family pheromone-processing serine protease n=1 Tax=Bacillus thermotolerans TaxID=1221996 RepID=UPI00057C59E8|nr:SepM family pheromone-processing serine protease [Bacillus thermotolerans]KKB39239.1 Lon-like protease [Bacillus thermotolerans]